MGEAREVMDRITEAMNNKDVTALAQLYAPDAVAITPDVGKLKGAEQIAQYLNEFLTAFPDFSYQPEFVHEAGDTAVDEGWWDGTNTGPINLPNGDSLPPTGRAVRSRGCDILTVNNGRGTSHRFYWDQMDLLRQLGLLEGV